MEPTIDLDRPALRYLAASDVDALIPAVHERIELARRAMVALVGDAELPAKLAVHPRPEGSFAHAMPALLRGPEPDGTHDLLGMKWVSGFMGNAALGLPAIHGTVVLNDPRTGVPLAILDAGPITAHRTAAVSGVALSAWPPEVAGRAPRVAMLGCGVQARSHLPVVAHLMPGADLVLFDRHPERATMVAEEARRLDGVGSAAIVEHPVEAVSGADVVLTLVSFGPDRQTVPADAFDADALVVAVDYDMSIPASVARDASLFLVDEAGQFLANVEGGVFAGYPYPSGIVGEALLEGRRPTEGRVLVTHLGVGLTDLVFADAVLRRAEAEGRGTVLAR